MSTEDLINKWAEKLNVGVGQLYGELTKYAFVSAATAVACGLILIGLFPIIYFFHKDRINKRTSYGDLSLLGQGFWIGAVAFAAIGFVIISTSIPALFCPQADAIRDLLGK